MAITVETISSLNYRSNRSAGEGLRGLTPQTTELGTAVELALAESETKGLRLTRGLLMTAGELDQGAAELESLVGWADRAGGAEARRLIARAARLSGGGLLMVDRMSLLPRDRLRPFVGDFFDAGGELKDVVRWLGVVGGTLRRARIKPDGTAGGAIDWVGDRFEDAVDAAKEAVEAVVDAVTELGKPLVEVLGEAASWTIDQVADLIEALAEAGKSLGEILEAAVAGGLRALRKFVTALVDLGHSAAEILAAAIERAAGALPQVVRELVGVGTALVDLVGWATGQALAVVRQVIGGIVDAGIKVVRLIEALASQSVELMRTAIRGLVELGWTLVTQLRRVLKSTLNVLESFLRAAIDLGLEIGQIVGQALAVTYAGATHLITAALRAGVRAAELLGEVVGEGYFVLRKVVNGIIQATGPLGEVLDWALSAAEDFVGNVWHATLTALRYAGAKLTDALDWALRKGLAAMESIVRAWESIGENLVDLYRWAKDASVALGERIFTIIGTITVKIRNSVSYVLGYLADDFLPGVGDFVTGLLEAGYAVADLVVRVVVHGVEVIAAAFEAALEVGVTLTELLLETVLHPADVVENAMRALEQIDQSLTDLYAAVEEAADELLEDVTLALRAIGASVVDMLKAVLEVNGGLLGTVIILLLNTLSSFRALTAQEKTDARTVFGDSLDLDDIYVSVEDLTNEIIFGIQDFFTGNPESRPFVTYNLINFDVDEGLKRHQLIHELTHVWQAEVTGPFYLAEAIHAQVPRSRYNYGYDEGISHVTIPTDYEGSSESLDEGFVAGLNAESALNAAGGDFEAFNREQQGQIAMHYFVRKVLLRQPDDSWAPWQPYIDVIRAAA